eukprot:CAMPEP_0172709598 /NCGR_PEP_ID=MMETSP1074-20121228/55154_1 /TAXON_ID=2916 /ORGANISM="Ceratium fusus, Strain PA161109" /LENGTH=360 /DNA_ID=CAMNT_0013532881 /DNA_START=186 /DNA_END=1268 /DNA_ORIENTATION=-
MSQVSSFVSFDRAAQNVTYIGDVEGDWNNFCNYVDHSRGLTFGMNEEQHESRRLPEHLELRLEDGWHFVFGGDAWDKGLGTLRVLDTMVRAKKHWPSRVHLLFGNRDLNRMGWIGELADRDVDTTPVKGLDLWGEHPDVNAAVDGEFECRRYELAQLQNVEVEEITDEDVRESYADCLKQGGYFSEYLERSQIAILLGDNLFVDGQVVALESMPGVDEDEERMRSWLEDLNDWARCKAAEQSLITSWDPAPSPPPPGERLSSTDDAEQGQYTVFISKSAHCSKLGLDTEARHSDVHLTIKNIHASGLIATWNSRHGSGAVKAGDKLISANGVSGMANNFKSVVTTGKHLNLLLQRAEYAK